MKDIELRITLADKDTENIHIPAANLHAVLKYIARDTDNPELSKIRCHQSFSIPAKYYLGGPVEDLPATQILMNEEFHKTLPQYITAAHNCKKTPLVDKECHGKCNVCREKNLMIQTIRQHAR